MYNWKMMQLVKHNSLTCPTVKHIALCIVICENSERRLQLQLFLTVLFPNFLNFKISLFNNNRFAKLFLKRWKNQQSQDC